MLKLPKFIWKDSVGSKVIASIILVVGGGALTLFWSTITAWSSTAIGWFAGKTAVANWLLAALVLISAFFILLITWTWLSRLGGTEERPLSRSEYKKDLFFKVMWRWQYAHTYNTIYHLSCFCPECDYQLVPHPFYHHHTADSMVSLKCPDCRCFYTQIEGEWQDIEQRVTMKIQKALRTGDWVNSLAIKKEIVEAKKVIKN
jgi:hypothetical protein